MFPSVWRLSKWGYTSARLSRCFLVLAKQIISKICVLYIRIGYMRAQFANVMNMPPFSIKGYSQFFCTSSWWSGILVFSLLINLGTIIHKTLSIVNFWHYCSHAIKLRISLSLTIVLQNQLLDGSRKYLLHSAFNYAIIFVEIYFMSSYIGQNIGLHL